MGILGKFKRFLKGEHAKDTFTQPSSNYLSQKSPITSTTSKTLQYPERDYLGSSQNPLMKEQRSSLQTLQNKPATQLSHSESSSYYKESPQYRELKRSLYERSTTPENPSDERLVTKLDVMTTQNQTIIELLREINMNLNYKIRR